MSRRVFVDDLSGETVRVQDTEAHHLMNVLRMGPGSVVELFDGSGAVAEARVDSVTRRHADLTVLARQQALKSRLRPLTVAAAPPKGDRLKWMTEKLTELGVHELILMETERSVVSPGDTKLEKLKSAVVSACKQSLRPRLMQLSGPVEFRDVLAKTSEFAGIFLAHPPVDKGLSAVSTGTSSDVPAAISPAVAAQPVQKGDLLLIGPEGGFTDKEVEAALNRHAVALGWPETILRIETAAVAFSTLLLGNLNRP